MQKIEFLFSHNDINKNPNEAVEVQIKILKKLKKSMKIKIDGISLLKRREKLIEDLRK